MVHAAAAYKDPDDWAEDARTNALGHRQRRPRRGARPASAGSSTSRRRSATGCTRSSSRSRSTIRCGPRTRATRSRKTAGEHYVALSGLDWVSFRLANAYGPRNISGPLPTFFQRLTTGKPCFVMDTRRDFIYVDDLVDVVVQAIDGAGRRRRLPRLLGLGLLDQGAVRRHGHGARASSSTTEVEVRAAEPGRRLHDPARSLEDARRTSAGARPRRSRRASPPRSQYYRDYGIDRDVHPPEGSSRRSSRAVSELGRDRAHPRRRRRRLRRQQSRARAAGARRRRRRRRRQPALGRARERAGRRRASS